jgi:malonyl-CoA O-methyltransferase
MFDYTLYKKKILSNKKINTAGFIEIEILDRLMDKLSFIKINPKNILCVGSSFGQLSQLMREKYPKANITCCDLLTESITSSISQSTRIKHITQDIDLELPYQDNYFDLIISNLLLHKLDHTEHFIREVKRTLVNQGMCLFSMFGVETLKEVAIAWQQIDTHSHIQPFFDMHDIGDLALKAGFEQPVLDVEFIKFTYKQAKKAIQDIQELNDPLALENMRKTLTGKKRWNHFTQQLEAISPITITYEVIYGHIVKQVKNVSKLKNNTAKVSIESLKETLNRK